jgi:uncharacterized protein YlxW (UPF0749 family)
MIFKLLLKLCAYLKLLKLTFVLLFAFAVQDMLQPTGWSGLEWVKAWGPIFVGLITVIASFVTSIFVLKSQREQNRAQNYANRRQLDLQREQNTTQKEANIRQLELQKEQNRAQNEANARQFNLQEAQNRAQNEANVRQFNLSTAKPPAIGGMNS